MGQSALDAIQIGTVPPSDVPDLTANQRTMYSYVRELLATKRVSDSTHAAALRTVGTQGLVDFVFTIGFYHQICITLNAFNVPLPPGVSLPFVEPAITGG